jgi:hypothetical protein
VARIASSAPPSMKGPKQMTLRRLIRRAASNARLTSGSGYLLQRRLCGSALSLPLLQHPPGRSCSQADVYLPGNADQYVPSNKHPVSDLHGSSSLLRRSVSPQYCDALAAFEVDSGATFQPSGCPRSHRSPSSRRRLPDFTGRLPR